MAAPRPISNCPTTASTDLNPCTPPPSLASSLTYSRDTLISLATPHQHPPDPDRLRAFEPILRNHVRESLSAGELGWGVDESLAGILDGRSVLEDLVRAKGGDKKGKAQGVGIGRPISASSSDTEGERHEIIFNFPTPSLSLSSHEKPPRIMLDFTNPFNNSTSSSLGGGVPIRLGQRKSSSAYASGVFQGFPSSVNSSSSSIHLGSNSAQKGDKYSLTPGREMGGMRLGRRGSCDSVGSDSSARSSISLGVKGALNPFAAPFPLPPTALPGAGTLPVHKKHSILKSTSPSGLGDSTSLPLPRPSSLPQKPGPLPPVFVKRETAALPQPMALPNVAPLGDDWLGDNALSGNEKRRMSAGLGLGGSLVGRATKAEMGISNKNLPLLGNRSSGPGRGRGGSRSSLSGNSSDSESASSGEKRPERLTMLGEKLKESRVKS